MRNCTLWKITCKTVLLFLILSSVRIHFISGHSQAASIRNSNMVVNIQILDERTGGTVDEARLFVNDKVEPKTYKQGSTLRIPLERGSHRIRIEAARYRTINFQITMDSELQNESNFIVHLPPLMPPPELQQEVLTSIVMTDRATLVGYVSDYETGGFIENVLVSVLPYGTSTYTNERGFFILHVPARTPEMNRSVFNAGPDLVTIGFEKSAYITHQRKFVQLYQGDNAAVYQIHLKPGIGVESEDERSFRANAAATWDPGDLKSTDPSFAEHGFQSEQWELEQNPTAREGRSQLAAPPCDASIRVGRFDCRCGSQTIEVYSLERYSQLVLPREWFASWHPEALKAGAVAVRTYGAYFIQRPLCSNYDICDSSCCQVFDPNREDWRTNQAVDDTFCQKMLTESGIPYFAQYSAENNSLNRCGAGSWCTARSGRYSCSGAWCGDDDGMDGVTGQCSDDDPDRGYCRFGHGRGMCQWGSQGWATRSPDFWYVWILTNYYPNAFLDF